ARSAVPAAGDVPPESHASPDRPGPGQPLGTPALAPHPTLPRRAGATPPPLLPALRPLAERPQRGRVARTASQAGREYRPQPLVRFVRSWPSISPPGKKVLPLLTPENTKSRARLIEGVNRTDRTNRTESNPLSGLSGLPGHTTTSWS